jgi:hypothetical protein
MVYLRLEMMFLRRAFPLAMDGAHAATAFLST